MHPKPAEDACDPETTSCLRHRLAMLSRALLDPRSRLPDTDLIDFVAALPRTAWRKGESSTEEIAALALAYVARTRRQSDQLAKMHFDDTVVDYRDDNRQMWQFIEEGDEEEAFDEKRKLEPDEEITRPAAAPLPRVGLQQPDLPPGLGQRVRSPAPAAATRPTSTGCWTSTARWPSA